MNEKKLHNQKALKELRKKLRNHATAAESILWSALRNRQLDGRKFRRQHSIGNFIVDFYCSSENLAIELDGDIHQDAIHAEYDEMRTKFLNSNGIKVLRIENQAVFDNISGVLELIRNQF